MAIYVAKRLGYSLITLGLVSFTVFFLIHLIPGDPARILLGLRATPESVQRLRHELGLDSSLITQYRIFMTNLFNGDLRDLDSIRDARVSARLRASQSDDLPDLYSEVLTLLVALPLGLVAALKREKLTDHAIRIVVVVAMAIPTFWIGTIFILSFSLKWPDLPRPSGYGTAFRGI